MTLRAWMLALVLCAGCKKQAERTPAAAPEDTLPPPIPAAEIKRGQDACSAYVTKVCACTEPAAAEACKLAKALPDAVETGLQIARNPETHRLDALQAQDLVRKTMKECIDQTAKLPALGCAP